MSYARNDRQLGLSRTGSGRTSSPRSATRRARYFAWASDHDVWGSRWLERLAAELDAHEEAALAYPLAVRIDDFGSEYPTRERLFDTVGVADPRARLRRPAGELRGAGEMVYGLMRRSAMERAGEFPLAMLADRLFLVRLALEGEFRQVRERLWYRRFRAGVQMTNARQRRGTFPEGAPLSAYLPWWVTHPVLLGGGYGADLARASARTASAAQAGARPARPSLAQAPRPRAARACASGLLRRRAWRARLEHGDAVRADSPDDVRRLYESGVAEIYAAAELRRTLERLLLAPAAVGRPARTQARPEDGPCSARRIRRRPAQADPGGPRLG